MNEVIPGLFVGDSSYAPIAPADMYVVCVLEGCVNEDQPGTYRRHLAVLTEGETATNAARLDVLAEYIHGLLRANQQVLVRCGGGVERSPLVVAWYLHRYQDVSLDEAYRRVAAARPVVQDRRQWIVGEWT